MIAPDYNLLEQLQEQIVKFCSLIVAYRV